MIREIKFRVWITDKNKMSDPFDLVGIEIDNFPGFNSFMGKVTYPIMQFTGLKDKNGEEIYEGDILSYEFVNPVANYVREMKWEEGMTECCQSSFDGYCTDKIESSRVIGTIYENPELLKEKNS